MQTTATPELYPPPAPTEQMLLSQMQAPREADLVGGLDAAIDLWIMRWYTRPFIRPASPEVAAVGGCRAH